MKAVYALYKTPLAAQRAFDALRSAGVAVQEITVMSSEPLEEWEFGSQDRATIMPWIAVLGAGLGLTTAYLLTSMTQEVWPIDTGGMPIVSNWPNMIIMFELTMLGAVLATVATLFVTARLPGRLPKFYDPEISKGRILVGAPVRERDNVIAIEQALRTAGAETIKSA